MKKLLSTLLLCLTASNIMAQKIDPKKDFHAVKRYPAYYATQGVAVDKHHFYAIENNHITKFTLAGDSITTWHEPNKDKIRHINSAFVKGHRLYCTHSNYPLVPMASSVEIFDTRTMQPVESISLGIDIGSCVWFTPGKGCWYAFFAHYSGGGKEPGKDVSWSQLVKFDKKWRRMEAWILPKELIEELHPNSLSGGVLVDDIFYCMGHDKEKCYLVKLPKYGMQLEWVGTINVPIPGQAIAIDKDGNMWGINRKNRQVVKASQK